MQETEPFELATTAWTQGWCARDHEALLALWHRDDTEAVYLPAERTDPLTGNREISEYLQTACTSFKLIRHEAVDPIFRRLSSDVGSVFYTLNWMFADRKGPIGGTCRVTALWRQTDEAWHLFHYAEAPLAPLLELQEFYEAVAADGLDKIPPRVHTT